MREQNFLRCMVLYFNYLLVFIVWISVFRWFDGSTSACVQLFLFLFVPWVVCLLLYGKWNREKPEELANRKPPVCHHEFLFPVCFVAVLGDGLEDRLVNSAVCFLLCLSAILLYFCWKFCYGKHLVLSCNPSVSAETGRRAAASLQSRTVRLGLITCLAAMALFLLTSWMPSVPYPGQQKQRQERTLEKKKPKSKEAEPYKGEMRERLEEEKEEPGLMLLIVRYAFKVFVIVIALAGLAAFIYAILIYFNRKRGRDGMEYREQLQEKKDNEEYTRLVPVVRKRVSFPADNDGEVRKIFYRAVKTGAGHEKVDQSRTARELYLAYLTEEKEGSYLTEVYQKARYAGEKVSDEEVHRLRHSR